MGCLLFSPVRLMNLTDNNSSSIGALLFVRTSRRTHCACKKASYETYLCHHNSASFACSCRRLSSAPLFTQYWQSCCLCGQSPSFSDRPTDGSSACSFLWYSQLCSLAFFIDYIDADGWNAALVVTNHFLWFRHFSTATYFSPLSSRYPKSRYDLVDTPTFTEIASYFGLCIWLVPFTLFVSLSAGENVLPSMGSEYATGTSNRGGRDGPLGGDSDRRRRRAKGLLKATIDGAMDWVGESAQLMGFWNGDQRRF